MQIKWSDRNKQSRGRFERDFTRFPGELEHADHWEQHLQQPNNGEKGLQPPELNVLMLAFKTWA